MKPLGLAVFAFVLGIHATVAAPVCADKIFETTRFTVCVANTARQDVRLTWTDSKNMPLRSFARLATALGPDAGHVQFAMNAGMFDERGAPIGLYVENGFTRAPLNTRTGDGNFYLKPNGVFWIAGDGALGLETTERYVSGNRAPQWATQSGPMLVIDGEINPQIAPEGPSKYIRNGVCVRDPHTAFFAVSDEPVSFGRLARFFRDVQGCSSALYLDGAISSLWAPSLAREDDAHLLGPMIVVLGR